MILSALTWDWRWDGFLHLLQDGHDLPRGPLGLLLYLPLAVLFWIVPPHRRVNYLTASSLALLLVTLGPGYTAMLLLLALLGLVLVRSCGRPGRIAPGILLCAVVYAGFIAFPQPPFIPPIRTPTLREPLYFYLHWAGIGYVFLKTVHVLVDTAQHKMTAPPLREFLAYLLFAPTVRMGPIYRYPEFAEQLASLAGPPPALTPQLPDSRSRLPDGTYACEMPAHRRSRPAGGTCPQELHEQHQLTGDRDFGAAAIRIVFGLVRLGVMSAMLKNFPIDRLFDAPWTLPPYRFVGCLYAAPMSIYLWISGYVDISIGMGLIMGFRVPENFQYPWKAASLAEFWRRWHITLGSWLRDYLYIPLGGNRRHVFLNYFITFLFCGVWHGLYLSYALWGMSQGVGLAVNRMWALYWKRHREAGSRLYQQLARLRIVNSPVNTLAAWLLTFHYQILTIAWFMDEEHAGRRVFLWLAQMLTGTG